ncbi:hypothetical protein SBOR_8499 [Sclerotinia borealis F-4128]|uniref:EKC/KEOPS complex subunit BUD32 n=1 Tax=Sclerotinia borealis (strain F-4128) TaxID=1432307 RepID=W9C8A8_SCLBF|nr:hypothetical protein SBOR_8499 [Sclerotinia borealis F-4128]
MAIPNPETTPPHLHLHLPHLFTYPSSTSPTLITQGAEALLYKSTYLVPSFPCALKWRPSKPYRHPILDARLTKARILAEARVLVKCRRESVVVPAVYAVDEGRGCLMMEWIEGEVVRIRLNEWLGRRKEREREMGVGGNALVTGEEEGCEGAVELMRMIGQAVGRMHGVGVVHGDLTTSNLMLRPIQLNGEKGMENGRELEGEIVIIDFGLASQSTADEDRAVDLYVLERAFGSTHPRAEGLFKEVLDAYGTSYKGAQVVLKKLEEVRMRGRKKSMLG